MLDNLGYKGTFKGRRKLAIFSTDITLERNIFQRIGATIEKAKVPMFVFTQNVNHNYMMEGEYVFL